MQAHVKISASMRNYPGLVESRYVLINRGCFANRHLLQEVRGGAVSAS